MKVITTCLALALCVVFYMSNMTYEQQSITPELEHILENEPSKELLSHVELNFWGSPISVDTWGYHSFIELLLRKATHFVGYGIVGVLFWLFYRKLTWKWPILIAIASTTLVASLDEYNQSFIPSRTGAVQDVIIDVAGAIFFICSIAFLTHIIAHRLNN